MKGFPKTLKTKADYYNCLAMVAAGELDAADLERKIESLEKQRYAADTALQQSKELLRLANDLGYSAIDHNGQMPDGVGIPVGNLTSQLFANIYLNKLDQYAKHMLGVGMYVRYMDDFIILSPDKEKLRYWLAEIERFLRDELRLELNPKTTILAAKNGIDFVGYKHRATHRKVRPDSIKRIKKTIKKYERGKITKEQLQKSIQSWTGHAGHADSYNLRKKIIILAQAAEKKGGSIS